MKSRLLFFVRVCVILALLSTPALSGLTPAMAQARSGAAAPAASQPPGLMFVENAGQFPTGARFQVRSGGLTLWLAEDALWLTIVEPAAAGAHAPSGPERAGVGAVEVPHRGANIKLSFVGANPYPRLEPFDRLDTVVSYFLGDDPARWRARVPVWGGVRYVGLYPGIDLELTSEQGRLLPRLAAQPGADASAVRLRVEGADAVAVEGDTLRLSTAAGETAVPLLRTQVLTAEPSAQRRGASVFDVVAPLTREDGGLPRLAATDADNPADLLYSTFLGANGDDYSYGIDVDDNGVAHVTGWTHSAEFPTTPGAFDRTYNGTYNYYDVFVVKLSASGSDLAYATFLGGEAQERGYGIVVDESGATYVAGQTYSADFPTTPNAFDTSCNGSDAFVLRLNADGSELEYGTFLGGSDLDVAYSIAVDGDGAAYVTGEARSSDFPTTEDAFDRSYNGGYTGDAFVVKLDADGSGLAYSTFLGGALNDGGYGIAADGSGVAFVTGNTGSADFPTTPGAFDTSYNGANSDAFVVRLSASGSALDYATFLGGGGDDDGYGIAVDGNGAAYVTGRTGSSAFPTTPAAFDTAPNGAWDVFVAKLNLDGTALDYSTFLGGSGYDWGYGLEIDASGAAYVTGYASSDFPTTPGAFDTVYNGGSYDAFVVKLSAGGSALDYATFLGGSEFDSGYDIAVGDSGEAYVTGLTPSPDFPTTPDAYDTSYNGGKDYGEDIFVAKLAMNILVTWSISGRVTDTGGQGIPNVTVSAGEGGSAITSANGDYAIGGVVTGTFALTPTLAGWNFDPPTRTVEVPPDATGQDFVGTIATSTIGGQITDPVGNPLPGVTITATGGYSAMTDVAGDYSLVDLPPGSYTLSPALGGYRFDPATRTVVVPPDATAQDFVGEPATYIRVYLPLVLQNQ